MRKAKQVQALACAALSALAIGQSASASVIIYEPFNYTAGEPIAGQNNNFSATDETWQPAGSSPLHVVGTSSLSATQAMLDAGYYPPLGNNADLQKSGTSSAYDRLNIPNAFNGSTPKYAANSTLYYSLLLNVPNTGTINSTSLNGLTIAHSNANANNDGLVAFNNSQGSQASAPSSWNGELNIRLGSTTGTYNLGIRASTTTANTTFFTGDLTPGQTYFIVVKATYGPTLGSAANSLQTLWVNPDTSTFGAASDPALTSALYGGTSNGEASNTAANDTMQSMIIGAGIATAGAAPNDTLIDEIRMGESWADVTTGTAAPEPATIGMLSLGGLALMRRRRRC